MSETVERLILLFGAGMVAMIALLLGLQIGFGALVEEEPRLVNAQSLGVAALVSAAITLAFGRDGNTRDEP